MTAAIDSAIERALLTKNIKPLGRTNSHHHNCLRTMLSPPYRSQYDGELTVCKESCNGTPTTIIGIRLLFARLGKAYFESRRLLSCRTWRGARHACTRPAVCEGQFVLCRLHRSLDYLYSDKYERMLRK